MQLTAILPMILSTQNRKTPLDVAQRKDYQDVTRFLMDIKGGIHLCQENVVLVLL